MGKTIMKHTCPECGTGFETQLDTLPLILKCTLCLALANLERLAKERYPEQGEQAWKHAKFVRDAFRKNKERPILELR
ncbi:MAG: hypothetical protein V4563_14545, partial [Pseudomonadota bacterium]